MTNNEIQDTNNNILVGDNPQKQKLYWEIYELYSRGSLTEKQLGQQYNYHPRHISRILKWCTEQLDNPKEIVDSQLKAFIDRMKYRIQEIENEIREIEEDKEMTKYSKSSLKSKLWAELRRTENMLGKLSGILSDAVFEFNDNRQVVVKKAEDLQRGQTIESES